MVYVINNLINNIDFINARNYTFICHLKNTVNISSSLLNKITNLKLTFEIQSGLYNKKYQDKNFSQKYYKRTLYSLKQLKKIIKSFEKIENGLPSNLNKLDTAIYIYRKLINLLKYEDKHCFNKYGNDIRRTLYSIVSKKAVCSGFALIFYEMLIRQGIKNYYLHSKNHLFNIIKINDNYYQCDITWDCFLNKKFKTNQLHYFANYPLFKKTHQLVDENIKYKPCFIDNLYLNSNILNSFLKTYKITRKDNTKFLIATLPFGVNIKTYVYYNVPTMEFYIIYSLEDFEKIFTTSENLLKECYANILLDSKRVTKKIIENNGNVGYGYLRDKFYKNNKTYNFYPINYIKECNRIIIAYANRYFYIFIKNNKFYLGEEKCLEFQN